MSFPRISARSVFRTLAAAALAGGLSLAPGEGHAGNVAWSVSVGGPGYAVTAAGPGYRGYPPYWRGYGYYGRPYVRPYYRPYYPVVYAPPVVYPAPVVYPPPYYYGPPRVGVVVAPGWRAY